MRSTCVTWADEIIHRLWSSCGAPAPCAHPCRHLELSQVRGYEVAATAKISCSILAVQMRPTLLSALLATVALSAAQGAAYKPRLIAKISDAHCDSGVRVEAVEAVTLSATTVSTVSAAAAAVGLSYHSGAGAATASTPVFQYIAVDKKRYKRVTARRALNRQTGQAGPATVAGPRAVITPATLPTECAGGLCSKLWGMNRIKAPDAWSAIGAVIPPITRKAMIIDDGVDMEHYDIIPQVDVTNSRTFCASSNNQPSGGVTAGGNAGHGTHVFGTAAGGWGAYNGQTDPNRIAGVAGPTQNQSVACNVFGNSDGADESDIIQCIAHAQKVKAHYAVNLSLGGPGQKGDATEQLYKDALGPFCAAGGMAIVAAGNGECVGSGCPDDGDYYKGVDVANSGLNEDGSTYKQGQVDYPSYMAKFFPDCVIAVANIQSDDKLEESSNWGDLVLLAAPGTDILSDYLTTTEGGVWAKAVLTGTSMASPHVTGAVILLRNSFPNATNAKVTNCLVTTADRTVKPYWPGTFIKGGVLNVKGAYDCLNALPAGDNSPPSSPTPSPPEASPSPTPGNTPDPGSTSCGDCTAGNQCSEYDCMCDSNDAGELCTCSAELGFREQTSVNETGDPVSDCVWNVNFTRTAFVKAAKNAKVALDFNILTDNGKLCSEEYVIDSVEIDTDIGLLACPKVTYTTLTRSSAAEGDERCASRTKLNKYTFKALSAGSAGAATKGKCATVWVYTTDGGVHEMTLQYTN